MIDKTFFDKISHSCDYSGNDKNVPSSKQRSNANRKNTSYERNFYDINLVTPKMGGGRPNPQAQQSTYYHQQPSY